MKKNPLEHFKDLTNPREDNPNRAIQCRINNIFNLISRYKWSRFLDRSRRIWLGKKFVEIPKDRIPSHDTIGDFFSRVKAKDFASCFLSWTSSLQIHRKMLLYR